MKTFLLAIVMLTSIAISVTSNAQEIIYEFPQSVNDKVQEHISHYGDTCKFVALFYVGEDDKYSLYVMEEDFSKNSKFKDIYDALICKTSRFVKINNVKMPMITGEDFIFADFGTVYTPESKSPKRRIGKKRVMFIAEGWHITFNEGGGIY